MSFAQKLIDLQGQRCESNYRLAKEIGVSQTTVANWREGKKPLNVYLEKIAEHYGVTVEELQKEDT